MSASSSQTDDMLAVPGNSIRDLYYKYREDAERIHNNLLDQIISDGLSDDALRALYNKADNQFKMYVVSKTHDVEIRFSLERVLEYAKKEFDENKRVFYVLDSKGDPIELSKTYHLQGSSSGLAGEIQLQWENYYCTHPKFMDAREKITRLFPGWKIGNPGMRWFEPIGTPHVCIRVSCDLPPT